MSAELSSVPHSPWLVHPLFASGTYFLGSGQHMNWSKSSDYCWTEIQSQCIASFQFNCTEPQIVDLRVLTGPRVVVTGFGDLVDSPHPAVGTQHPLAPHVHHN